MCKPINDSNSLMSWIEKKYIMPSLWKYDVKC